MISFHMMLAEWVLIYFKLLGVAWHNSHVHGVDVQTHAAQGCVSEHTCWPRLASQSLSSVLTREARQRFPSTGGWLHLGTQCEEGATRALLRLRQLEPALERRVAAPRDRLGTQGHRLGTYRVAPMEGT